VALGAALPRLTHLRFGRLAPRDGALPGAAAANAADAPPAPAGGEPGGGGGGGGGVALMANIMMGNPGLGLGPGGGGGDNLLADLANVVDGLIQNMQARAHAAPAHPCMTQRTARSGRGATARPRPLPTLPDPARPCPGLTAH
jgi:hypothetical protein